jgi:hypothetical protein
MEKTLKSIDIGPIGTITRHNGQVLEVPRLSNLKIIKIAKFLGIDGMKLYDRYKEIVEDPFVSDSQKWMTILSELPEETVVHLLSILLDMDDNETLSLDPIETLEIVEIYVDNLNIEKAFTIVRNLAKKMFNKELPDIFKKTDGEASLKS